MNASESTANPENIDPAEINKFSSLASRWWDKESEFKALHDINPLRVSYIEQHCSSLKDKQVLDIGCGGGILSEGLAQKQAQVTGIDMSDAALEVARLHLHESSLNIDYQWITAEAFCSEHIESFDVVCCLEMLEHVPDPASILQAAAQALKPGGYLILSTLNRNPKSFALAIVAAEYLMGLVPKGTHEYAKFLKPSELAKQTRSAGLELLDITGLTYNPLTRHYRLCDDVDVNYLMTCQKT